MAYGCFTDRADPPDLGRAEAALGAARPLWDDLVRYVEGRRGARAAWRFYGRNYGWALAYKKSGRALAALFPDQGGLTVLVVLSGERADAAQADNGLSAATREQIAALPRFKEGCWVFVRVAGGGTHDAPGTTDDAAAQVADARRLIALRAGETMGEPSA